MFHGQENKEKHKIVASAGLGEMICGGVQDLDGQDAQKHVAKELTKVLSGMLENGSYSHNLFDSMSGLGHPSSQQAGFHGAAAEAAVRRLP